VTISFFILAVVYAWFLAVPDYKSQADVMVQVEQSSSTTTDPNFDLVNASRLLDTVRELMTKDVVLQNAILRLEQLGYQELTVSYLRDGLTITSSNTSFFINIAFIDENTALAKDVVDAVIDAVIEITDEEDAFPVLTDKIRRTSFSSEATYNSPNRLLFAVIGLVLGGIVSVGIVFVRELLSTNFKSKDEIEHTLQVQVLGIIPLMEMKESKHGKK
jgi:capsular polysaccharide biosynthesis protein